MKFMISTICLLRVESRRINLITVFIRDFLGFMSSTNSTYTTGVRTCTGA